MTERQNRNGAGRPDGPSPTLRRLSERFGEDILETHAFRGDDTAVVSPERLVDVCLFLRDEAGLDYDMLVDLTAVDDPGRDPRFEVVYHFLSLRHLHRVRVKVRVSEEDPCVDTLTPHWGCADWLEREVWDMFGVRFRGHPDLKRILMYEQFEGHPLRKDYPIDRRQPLIGPRD
jgi:NADH-quinone oxidoreductase subunit C